MRRFAQQFVFHPSFYCTSSRHSSNSKLFVGGLSWYVDERSLKEAFSSFGEVTEGRSRGFGFVYFSGESQAISAKDAMDGKPFLGRPLRISFALDKVRGVPLVVPRVSSGDSSS
ncbi:glycine-rich RNA-binding protein 4, mitochondrial isoform X2 [Phalaenopsis equestris]|uniref:glycine-rich RNA-binding protein 4, mitochondrial isoform X2 n=1 Tax=Phalaenopsis equestris TaxID=78828 RepID=UPI0009E2D4DC|nr:glycine-rich RNA-binding protein 4, mitochondrial isoform X2 [Phalaenopsis equestris]